MRPRDVHDDGSKDLLRHRLENILNPGHELVPLAASIYRQRFEDAFAPVFSDIGQPALPTRLILMASWPGFYPRPQTS